MENKVLVPLDGSDLAAVAVEYAEQVARALGGGIVLFGVVHEAQLGAADEALRHEVDAAVDAMGPAAARVQAAGLAVEREVGIGNPRDTIVQRAAALDVAMIVMASHGRTGLDRIVRGSVASGVVAHTSRPTLVVRPFRDPRHQLDFEHADHLPPEQSEAVRQALAAPAMVQEKPLQGSAQVSVTFETAPYPEARSVSLAADFNDWDLAATPMKQREDGCWWATVRLTKGQEYAYRFLVDGREWVTDERADRTVPNGYGETNAILDLRDAVPGRAGG